MKRLLTISALVLFAAACSDGAHITQPESVAASAPSFDQGGVPNAASGLEPSVVGAFEVNVKVTMTLIPELTGPVGTENPNCYTFQGDGVWLDPAFPFSGTWTQDVTGANARYTAIAGPVDVRLVQNGKVTTVQGGETRKLKANSAFSVDGTVLAEFLSRGYEVDSCPD